MGFILFEDFYMDKVKESTCEIESIQIIDRAPDCVYQTISRRMDELTKEIAEYEDELRALQAEYIAHANFLLGSPFEQRNLSHSSENREESPQPLEAEAKGGRNGQEADIEDES